MEEKFKYPKPRPLIKDNQRFCPWCWQYGLPNVDSGLLTLLSHKRFLCDYHYKIYRQDKERARQRFKRGEDKLSKAKEYETELGTSDLAKNRKMKEDGTPDFDDEYKRVHKELELTMKYGSSDYMVKKILSSMSKSQRNGYKGIPEERTHMEKDQAYSVDYDDIITFDTRVGEEGEGVIVDRLNALEYEWEMDNEGKWFKVLFRGKFEDKKKGRHNFEY